MENTNLFDKPVMRAGWCPYPKTLMFDKNFTDAEKKLYCLILDCLDSKDSYCSMENSFFATMFHTSESWVSRTISKFKRNGYLKIEYVYREYSKAIDKRQLFITYKGE